MGQGQYGPDHLIGADVARVVELHVRDPDRRVSQRVGAWTPSDATTGVDPAGIIGQRSASVPSMSSRSGAGSHAEVGETALEHLEGEVVLGAGRVEGALSRRRVETRGHVRRADVVTTGREPGDRQRRRGLEHVERPDDRFLEPEDHPGGVTEIGHSHQASPTLVGVVGQPHAHLAHLAVGVGDASGDRREALGLPAGRCAGRRHAGRRRRRIRPDGDRGGRVARRVVARRTSAVTATADDRQPTGEPS